MFALFLCWQVSYGASSSIFSSIENFPSFLRTVHPNKEVINVIIRILQHFGWRWTAFLNSDNDFGIDGRNLFIQSIKGTDICLAYTENLNVLTDFTKTFQRIKAQKINVIIVFAPKMIVEALVDSAIRLNITNKVWIADDGWSLNKNLPKKQGIRSIGTVIGVSQPVVTIPGFDDFIFSAKSQKQCEEREQQAFCNQVCKCGHLSAEEITTADPTFSFPVYSAVYAIAHALHKVLQCGAGSCNGSMTVQPHMVSPHSVVSGTSGPSPQGPTVFSDLPRKQVFHLGFRWPRGTLLSAREDRKPSWIAALEDWVPEPLIHSNLFNTLLLIPAVY